MSVTDTGSGDGVDKESMTLPEPIKGALGATILGPRNIPLERENPDLLASPQTDAGTIPNLKFSFAAARNRVLTGGWAREVTVRELPVATELAGVNMRLKPGGIRELHWHKEAEWAYMLAGRARITAVDQNGRNFVDDVSVGDLWNFPAGIPHSIQGLHEGCEFLLVFDDGNFSENETFLLTDWLKHTPRAVLAKNFGVPEVAFADLPADPDFQRYIFGGTVPGPLASDSCNPRRALCHGRSATTCWLRIRSGWREARYASLTPPTSLPRPPSLLRLWRSRREGCASCTGTPTPTSGSTTSPVTGA